MGYAITKIPEDFHLHKGVKRVYDQRRNMIESGEGIDWGTAEALAFGTLISEGGRPCLWTLMLTTLPVVCMAPLHVRRHLGEPVWLGVVRLHNVS